MPKWSAFAKKFFLLPTGGKRPGDGRSVLSKEFKDLYQISATLAYMGIMSTPTAHRRGQCGFE